MALGGELDIQAHCLRLPGAVGLQLANRGQHPIQRLSLQILNSPTGLVGSRLAHHGIRRDALVDVTESDSLLSRVLSS
jgi:hypothetical protein